jgi:hypothetical protein
MTEEQQKKCKDCGRFTKLPNGLELCEKSKGQAVVTSANKSACKDFIPPEKKRSKYNAQKRKVDNIIFDSIAEANYYGKLKGLKQSGEILHIDIHPVFTLTASIKYIADFMIFYKNGKIEVIDVKGMKTRDFKLKEKLFNEIHPLKPLKIVKDI